MNRQTVYFRQPDVIRLKFKAMLRRHGMDQKTLAKRMGVSPSTVSDWANARTMPSRAALNALAETYGLDRELFSAYTPAEIGDLVYRGRRDLGVNKTTLHRIAGISRNTMCDIESGAAMPSKYVLGSIVLALGKIQGRGCLSSRAAVELIGIYAGKCSTERRRRSALVA